MRMEPSPDSRDDNVNGSDTILVISKSVIRARKTVYKAGEYGSVNPIMFLDFNICSSLLNYYLTRWMWYAVLQCCCRMSWRGEDVWYVRVTLRVEWWSESDHWHSQLWPDSHTANTSQVRSWMSRIIKSPFRSFGNTQLNSHSQYSIEIIRQ